VDWWEVELKLCNKGECITEGFSGLVGSRVKIM